MGSVPHFNIDVTDTSIIITWTPVPKVAYKVKSPENLTHSLMVAGCL